MVKSREDILGSLKDFLKKEAHAYNIDMAFLYGSWATGLPRHDSDVDVAIVFSEKLSDEESFKCISDISFYLSSEVKQEVNIIQIHQDFRKPMLYYNAIILGLPIFVKDDYRYIRLKIDAVYQMEDFCIFGRKWQLEVAKKNLESLNHV